MKHLLIMLAISTYSLTASAMCEDDANLAAINYMVNNAQDTVYVDELDLRLTKAMYIETAGGWSYTYETKIRGVKSPSLIVTINLSVVGAPDDTAYNCEVKSVQQL